MQRLLSATPLGALVKNRGDKIETGARREQRGGPRWVVRRRDFDKIEGCWPSRCSCWVIRELETTAPATTRNVRRYWPSSVDIGHVSFFQKSVVLGRSKSPGKSRTN